MQGFVVYCWLFLSLLCTLCFSANLTAEDTDQVLKVGTKSAPPFAYQTADGTWTGASINLLDRIAEVAHFRYELVPFEQMDELLAATETQRVDLSIAAITVTPERESRMDFSHPFYVTGLGIATHNTTNESSWWLVIKAIISTDFLKIIGGLIAILMIMGFLVWLCERTKNNQFSPKPLPGVGSGFWWSAVTMTTVGYGDKAPITPLGRGIAVVWMFTALIMVASITAQITSALTLSAFEQGITGPEDLRHKQIGVIHGTTAAAYARQSGLNYQEFNHLDLALDALNAQQIDAVVHDHPVLSFSVQGRNQNSIWVLPETFERQDYGIALPLDSKLRKRINIALVKTVTSREWVEELASYGLR